MTYAQKVSAIALVPLLALGVFFGMLPGNASADSGSKSRIEMPSVAIGADGKVLVKQAKVTAVEGSVITASIGLGSGALTWTVNTDSTTKFYNRASATGVLADIAVNDLITFGGTLERTGLTVKALAIKDLTGVVQNATVGGKVESVNTSATSLVLDTSQSGNGNDRKVTVVTNSATAITMNGNTLPFAQILIGDRVKAVGTLSADGLTLTATSLTVSRPTMSDDRNFNGWVKDWFKSEKKNGKGKSGDGNDD